MIKSVVFQNAYDEASVRKTLKAFDKFPSVTVHEISLSFAATPDVQFVFTGNDTEHLIQQANATEKALKEATA